MRAHKQAVFYFVGGLSQQRFGSKMVDYIVLGGSSRSVGRAEASNSFPLLIPCHWVIHADFSIGGYKLGEKVRLEILLSKTEASKKLKGCW